MKMLHKRIMSTLWVAISLLFVVRLQQHVNCATTDPFLSTTGNASILVFLDLHLSYNDDACSDPDWEIFELAHSLYWESVNRNHTGIEIYDTCSSTRHVFKIIRKRLSAESCSTQYALSPVSGVISYSSASINSLLTQNFNTLHVVIGNDDDIRHASILPDGPLYVQLASNENIEMMVHMLQSLHWSYVSTLSDRHPESQLEHSMFQRLARVRSICVQYSQTVQQWTDRIQTIKTNGAVIFVKQLAGLENLIAQLPNNTPVVVITENRGTNEFSFPNSVLVFSDAFGFNNNLSEYMTLALWNGTKQEEMLIQYYITNHNCSYINQSMSEQIECTGIEDMRVHFNTMTSSRLVHTFLKTLDLMEATTADMIQKNCTNFLRSCLDVGVVSSRSMFLGVENGSLLNRPPYHVSVTLVRGGIIQKTDIFSSENLNVIVPDIRAWTNDASSPFPASVCSSWCPACQSSKCSNSSNQLMQFDGDYLYIPGDIVITGMIPLSQKWDRMSTQEVCSGLNPKSNFDIRAEAFLYAVLSAQQRLPDLFPNISIGALLFDTCSDDNRASQILINFESCQYQFSMNDNNWPPSPEIVPAYVFVDSQEEVMKNTKDMEKFGIHVDDTGNILAGDNMVVDRAAYDFDAVIEFLNKMNISFVGVITSQEKDNHTLKEIFDKAYTKNICISYHGVISSSNSDLINTIRNSQANVIVIVATSNDVDIFFRSLTSQLVVKTWILMETREHWLDTASFPLPRGSIIFGLADIQNLDFNRHINHTSAGKSSDITTQNFWMDRYNQTRPLANIPSPALNQVTRMQASDIIKAIDLTLDAIGRASNSVCGKNTGLCPDVLSKGGRAVLEELNRTLSQEGSFKRMRYSVNYVISNLHEDGLAEVGRWTKQQLLLDTDKLKSYDSKGSRLETFRESFCFITPCACVNVNVTQNQSGSSQMKQLDYEKGFKDSTAMFKKDLWTIIVVIIAGTGSLLTLIMMVYIMCKVCAGALMRRYLALGILLLIGIVFLFMSVLPFVFTPSEPVCGMRYFAHGFSYAFCFGIMLSKMMTLRDYRYIGLGGEVSRINQLLIVFFITSVQIAIGVQWWVMRTPVVFSEEVLGVVDGDLRQITYYACDFVRDDFIAYHSYVIVLLVLCCCYSISVRNETQNMKEARLILVCSWFSLAVWVAIIVTFLTLDRKYLEPICAVGILANALSMVVIIYLPKLTAISRLRYDVSEHNAHKENGYKLDPDFMFERPYSLPGTLHSSITDKALTYPRSLATFDTSLSY